MDDCKKWAWETDMAKNRQAWTGKERDVFDAEDGQLSGEDLGPDREKIKSIFDNLPFVLISLDEGGLVRCWNSMAEILFNIRRPEAIGRPFRDLAARLNWTEVMQSVDSTFQNPEFDNMHKEVRYMRNDGSTGFMDLRVLNFLDLSDPSSQMVLVVGNDITDFKIMQGQLGQAQKLEAIGQLASGIAHEINAPAQYVSDNLRFLRDSFSPLSEVLDQLRGIYEQTKPDLPRETVERTEELLENADLDFLLEEVPYALDQGAEGMDRISRIVLSMKQFAHPGDEEKTWLDLNNIIRNAVTVTRNAWKYDADIDLNLQKDLPEIRAIRGGINQVLLNTIVNAADAIKEKGEKEGLISISTQAGSEMVTIRISDTGTGMPEKVRERIFDPFYTTKEVGKGTGQGLSIVHSIVVDQHGGNIMVDSAPGEGTTFTISLPIG